MFGCGILFVVIISVGVTLLVRRRRKVKRRNAEEGLAVAVDEVCDPLTTDPGDHSATWRSIHIHNFEGGQKWSRQTEWSIEPFLEETVKIPTAWISKTKYHAHCETATNQPENYLIEKPENVSFKSHQYCSLSFIFRLYVINSSSAITSHVWSASRLAEVRKQMVLRCYNSTLRWEIWQT